MCVGNENDDVNGEVCVCKENLCNVFSNVFSSAKKEELSIQV
jgi:hypothetical protein